MWHILPNTPHFHGRRCLTQSKDCSALQDSALQCSHQSVVHTVGGKQCMWHHVFKCRRRAFIVFFMKYTLCQEVQRQINNSLHVPFSCSRTLSNCTMQTRRGRRSLGKRRPCQRHNQRYSLNRQMKALQLMPATE